MVPLQLALKNFMSYGEETTVVDFRDMHVICLSGDNGHGKSALLDAITWALWGETRLGRQNHDQLVRIGADEMSVVLDFDNGGNTYRARRQRSRKSSGNIWELQVAEPGGSWRSLTAQGTSDTGRAITDLLRMSYETFLNSAYLKQGRADEFVRQSANKRKEILSEILDLSRYDDLEAHARTHMRECSDQKLDQSRAINQIDAELSGASDAPEKLSIVEQQVAALTSERSVIDRFSQTLADARAKLNTEKARLAEHSAQIKELEKRKAAHLLQISEDQKMIEEASKLIADKERIERDVALNESLLVRLEQLQGETRIFRSFEARRVQLQSAIDASRRELERDLKAADVELQGLFNIVATLPQLEQRLNALEVGQTQSQSLQLRMEVLDAERQDVKARFAELGGDKKRCDFDKIGAERRLERVLNQKENCEICGSPLPEAKLKLLADECAASVEKLGVELARLKREGFESKRKIEQLDLDIAEANAGAARLQEARLEIARLQQQVQYLREQQAKLLEVRRCREKLSALVESSGFAQAERQELAVLLPQHASLVGVEAELISTQQQLRSLRAVEAAHARLLNAERDLGAATLRRDSAQVLAVEIDDQIARLQALAADAPQIDAKLELNRMERENNQTQAVRVASQLQQAERELGRLQSVLERSHLLARQRSARLISLQSSSNDEELYTLLAGSFGKRGVQALIIENALPELESDANDLLQRLTDGQMSLTLQTTRQAKSKLSGDAPIETLDIVISDSLGSRPLEMYSGGESFRISFALRIALSKLLARHAGAQLQTLIIDEGFGTQDARGREKLVDSIMAVQSDFSQIIVITHVDEIKDAFSNRIEVFKTPTGSEVNLVVGAALG